jgi:hypothetical protein
VGLVGFGDFQLIQVLSRRHSRGTTPAVGGTTGRSGKRDATVTCRRLDWSRKMVERFMTRSPKSKSSSLILVVSWEHGVDAKLNDVKDVTVGVITCRQSKVSSLLVLSWGK